MNALPLHAGMAVTSACMPAAVAHAQALDRAADGIDCNAPDSTLALDLCAADRADEADALLNTTYRHARSQLQQQAADGSCTHCADAEKQLIHAQRAWIQLRDDDCAAVYAFNADGTSRNSARSHCQTTLTQDRTRQLRAFYEL